MPKNVTELPDTMPWNMLGLVTSAPLNGSPTPPVPGTAHPLKLPHNCWRGFAGDPGSSINNKASDPVLLRMRWLMLVFRKIVLLACGRPLPTAVGDPPVQFRRI